MNTKLNSRSKSTPFSVKSYRAGLSSDDSGEKITHSVFLAQFSGPSSVIPFYRDRPSVSIVTILAIQTFDECV